MTKAIIIILILMIPIVLAASPLPMCKDRQPIGTNCTMITHVMTGCSTFNYSIFNLTGAEVAQNNLTVLNGSIYKFNFTEQEGDYIIKLCDDFTREIRVKTEDENNMVLFALILLPLILGFFLLIGANTLKDNHAPLKIGLFLLSFPTFFTSMHFGMLSLIKFYNFTALEEAVAFTTLWISIMFGVIILYFFIYFIYLMFGWIMTRKKLQQDEKDKMDL